MTQHKALTPIQSDYYASLIDAHGSARMMVAVYRAVTDDDLPRCRWWARGHLWQHTSEQGSVVTGKVTGRGFFCPRCRTGFSVGALGYHKWTLGGTK